MLHCSNYEHHSIWLISVLLVYYQNKAKSGASLKFLFQNKNVTNQNGRKFSPAKMNENSPLHGNNSQILMLHFY